MSARFYRHVMQSSLLTITKLTLTFHILQLTQINSYRLQISKNKFRIQHQSLNLNLIETTYKLKLFFD